LTMQIFEATITITAVYWWILLRWFILYYSERLDYYNKTVKNHHMPNVQHNNSYI